MNSVIYILSFSVLCSGVFFNQQTCASDNDPFLTGKNSRLFFDCVEMPENFSQDYPQMVALLKTVKTSSEALNLFAEVKNRFGSIKLELSQDSQTKGNFYRQDKIMRIRKSIMNKPMEFCEVFLWELCNAANYFLALPLKFSRDKDEYAFFTEAAEHRSHIRHNEVLKNYFKTVDSIPMVKTIIEQQAGISVKSIISNIEQDPKNTLKGYWQSVNKNEDNETCSHANLYRNWFADNKERLPAPIVEKYDQKILELVRYALSEWFATEAIPHLSVEGQRYYRNSLGSVF